MISAVRPCVPAGATRRAAPGARPAPLAARRTSLRVRASYEPDDKSKVGDRQVHGHEQHRVRGSLRAHRAGCIIALGH